MPVVGGVIEYGVPPGVWFSEEDATSQSIPNEEIDAAIVKAALDECGMVEVEYQRDYFGRMIAPNFKV